MYMIKNNKFIQTIIVIIPLLYMQGCAVLTKSQVDAAGAFAKAADKYSQLPGGVINIHADAMLTENIYSTASLKNFKDKAPSKINTAVDDYLKLKEQAAKADSALSVIGTYVKLLKKLTADDFTGKLQEEATSLGVEIDGAVEQYNELYGDDISSFGSVVGAIVRGGGGIITRYKQAKALKKTVVGADLAVNKMSIAVVTLMDKYICNEKLNSKGECNPKSPGYGQVLEAGLTKEYGNILKREKVNNSVKDLQNISQLLIKAKSIRPLAEKTKNAMITFRTAHNILSKKLNERRTLKKTIDQIKVLSAEVNSAQKLLDEIENKS